jgi:threonine/homoserine/homoserine lactone efflux protein
MDKKGLPNMELLLSHFLLGISFAVPMGPVNFEIVRRGIDQGFLCAWIVSLGAITADVFYLIAINQGISTWLSIKWLQIALTWLGALFFIKLSYSSIKSSLVKEEEQAVLRIAAQQPSKWNAFWTGFLIALMNPISFLFWLGVYGSLYVNLIKEHDPGLIMTSIIFLFLGIAVWNINVATTVHISRKFLQDKAIRIVTFITGLILLGFGIKFLVKGISYFF